MRPAKKAERLNKLLAYMLGNKPDEFGLAPDSNGFVSTKELLFALSHEPGFGYARKASLNEILLTAKNPCIEIIDNKIKFRDWDNAWDKGITKKLPKLLYTFVRQRGQSVAMEEGISPIGGRLVLARDKELAVKMGKQKGASIILTVNTKMAMELGVEFCQKGEELFTAPHIPVGSFHGPPLPKKSKTLIKEDFQKAKKLQIPKEPPTPGSFFMDLEKDAPKPGPGKKGRKKKGWKEEARKERRRGKKGW